MNAVLRSPDPLDLLPGRELADAARRHLARAVLAGSVGWGLVFLAAVAIVTALPPRVPPILPPVITILTPPPPLTADVNRVKPPPTIPRVTPPPADATPKVVKTVDPQPPPPPQAQTGGDRTEGKTGAQPDSHDQVVDTPPEHPGPPPPDRYIWRDVEPEPIEAPKPVYDDLARQAGVEGVVIVQAFVATDGHVAATHVARSVPLLDRAATDAIARWRFKPALANGHPVAVWVTIPVRFTLH